MTNIRYFFMDYSMMCIYLYILFKYCFMQSNMLNLKFIACSLLTIFVNVISIGYNKLSIETIDTMMFLCHMLFVKTLFAIISDFIILMCGILFYFGFAETILFVSLIYISIVSRTQKNNNVNINNTIVKKIFDNISKLVEKISNLVKCMNCRQQIIKYISLITVKIYYHIKNKSSMLSQNTKSQQVIMHISQIVTQMKMNIFNAMIPIATNYFFGFSGQNMSTPDFSSNTNTKNIFDSIFEKMPTNIYDDINDDINDDNDNIDNNNFDDVNRFMLNNKNILPEEDFEDKEYKEYKNISNIDINMNFLNNSSIDDLDSIEDLDDNASIMKPSTNTINSEPTPEKKVQTEQERKLELKKNLDKELNQKEMDNLILINY
ncbi:hypothetical protein LBA_00329 [Megavirus lba]|uniref:Uncharacterized protein n=1 Tax=Megavirus lba TaxID=1235314 RepID=L7Y5N7_9VIRU|nr:hypothetical protein LBA_00329 [Megavirus lba]